MTFDRMLHPRRYIETSITVPACSEWLGDFLGAYTLALTASMSHMTESKADALSFAPSLSVPRLDMRVSCDERML